MKVIQILPELNSGGVERGTLELGQYLNGHGHESVVISNGGQLVNQLEAEGSSHITLPVHRKSLWSFRQVGPLRRVLIAERPDIVHIRSRVPGWITWLALKKIPPKQRPRLISTVHGFYSVNRYSTVMTKGDSVICVSDSIKQYVLENYPDVPENCLKVVHRGVDPAQYNSDYRPSEEWLRQWEEAFPDTRGKKLLTLPGRITRLKGHEDFLHILQNLPADTYHGIIAGGAHPRKEAYLNELKAKVAELGLSTRVTFTGHRSDLRDILSHSDLVLSLSQTPESFGRTTLEALSLGTPVVGYDHGGVGEILDTSFPSGRLNRQQLEKAPEKIIEILSANSLSIHAPEPYTLDNMLSGILSLYQNNLTHIHPAK